MAVAESALGQVRRVWAREGVSALTLPLVETAIGCAVFMAALLVYNATLTPSLSYVSLDGNELATVPYQLGLAHSTGYPLYTWLGKLFTFIPIGDVAHRMNLMSAVGAAGGSALLFAAVLMVIRDGQPGSAFDAVSGRRLRAGLRHWLAPAGAAVGALMFAFSTTLWSQAVIAEVYAPNAFMVALTLVLLLVWARHETRRVAAAPEKARSPDAKSLGLFAVFALAFGLSAGTHLSNLALAPGFIAFILLTNWRLALQPRFVLAGLLGAGLGALQFLWLPYKASNVNDAFLARNTPNDLQGIYNYTLNAFPQLKWSYPLSAVPDRVVMYLDFLWLNFRLAGIFLAVAGGLAMSMRNPRAFFLFAPSYLAQLVFFLEYRASDIDVFFITAHLLTAVFIGYGAWALADAGIAQAAALWRSDGPVRLARFLRPDVRRWAGRAGAASIALVLAFFALQPAISLARHWGPNDQSDNTGINDFYETVFRDLPQDSVLIGRGGVFGYDMFYWRYVYNLRPDISIPLALRFDNNRAAQDKPTYTVTPPNGQGGFGGPSPVPGGLQSSNAWYVPVLAAPVQTDEGGSSEFSRQLTLYKAQTQAPQLFTAAATPQTTVGHDFGSSTTLVGYTVDSSEVEAGGSVHLKLFWQTNGSARPQVATRVGDTRYYESHELGFGLLQRYVQANGQPAAGSLLVEEYDLVVLSSLDKGPQPFHVRVSGGTFGQTQSEWVNIGSLTIK